MTKMVNHGSGRVRLEGIAARTWAFDKIGVGDPVERREFRQGASFGEAEQDRRGQK